jgi:glucose/arabinose dehydrogenase
MRYQSTGMPFLLVLLLLAAAACGANEGSGPAESGGEPVPGPETPPEPVVEEVLTGLEAPWEVVFAPDGRTFITERPGAIRVVEGGELREEPYAALDVREIGEGGQLGLALDPDFEENGYLYAYYTTESESGDLVNRMVRLVEEGESATEDRVLLEVPAYSIHNGGRVAFGPDGKLYATLGDAGEEGLAQEREVLAGKIVRLEPDGSVPEDNPFEGSPVYTEGHRNPQGLAWHPASGDLYAPEHGPTGHDEVNRIRAGENYGWPEVAGAGGEPEFVDPVVESGEDTWAPSGATFATEGPYAGDLFFTGLRGSALYRVALDESGERAGEFEALLDGEFGRLRTVVEGPDGALYMLTNNTDGRGTPREGDDRLLRVTFGE